MTDRRSWLRDRLPSSVLGLVTLAALVVASPAEAQARGATQRESRALPGQNDAQTREGRALLDRMAQRIGRSIGLTADQTQRLQRELQSSRERRAIIAGRARLVRQELGLLAREQSTDETRMSELLDEAVGLEIEAAEVAADEQRRLAEFLTPTQRVRVMWLRQRLTQEALRRRDSIPPDGSLFPR
ncbi:MAG: hypothetical protein R3195_20340 [Gemmatimonadota bacterium]|nr:hypothetical protein [Gemmatimonadota bacterium]